MIKSRHNRLRPYKKLYEKEEATLNGLFPGKMLNREDIPAQLQMT